VLAILKPMLKRVDASGFLLESWGLNNIHNGVRIMLHEVHDKYDQFGTQFHAIRQEHIELCDGPGMELHGTIYTFKLVLGGDMAFQGGAFRNVGAAHTSFALFATWPTIITSISPHLSTNGRALHRRLRIHLSLQL
jgi:hypothetical protein